MFLQFNQLMLSLDSEEDSEESEAKDIKNNKSDSEEGLEGRKTDTAVERKGEEEMHVTASANITEISGHNFMGKIGDAVAFTNDLVGHREMKDIESKSRTNGTDDDNLEVLNNVFGSHL